MKTSTVQAASQIDTHYSIFRNVALLGRLHHLSYQAKVVKLIADEDLCLTGFMYPLLLNTFRSRSLAILG